MRTSNIFLKLGFIGLLSFVFSACSGDGESSQEDGKLKENLGSCGDNAGLCGDPDPCQDIVYESVGWEEATDLGVTAAEVFGAAEGSCTEILSWENASPMPVESELTVTLTLDTDTAEFGAADNAECETEYLKIRGTVTLSTADGSFNDTGEVTLTYDSESSEVGTILLKKDLDELGGNFEMPLGEDKSGELHYDFEAPGIACTGELRILVNYPLDDNTASSGIGTIGSWSSTGCDIGQNPVNLSQTNEDEETISAQLIEAWGSNTFDTKWENNTNTTLGITLDFSNDPQGCAERTVTYVAPVSLTYSTADGVLGESSTEANLTMSLEEDNSIRTSSLWINDNRKCEDENDTLSYGFGDCDTLSGITVQLGLSLDANGALSVSDEGLMIYEYDRDSSAAPGAADRVRILSFL
jgi:hypothetical protein